jgi:hypothetical protein
LLIWYDPSWKIADPVCTWLFGFIVMFTTIQMLWSNISVSLLRLKESEGEMQMLWSTISVSSFSGSVSLTARERKRE